MKPGRIIGLTILAFCTVSLAVFVHWAVAILFLLFISGAPLFTVMTAGAILGAMIVLPRGLPEFDGNVRSLLNLGLGDRVQEMSTIPLFIYAGYLLAEAKTADRLVRFANALLGWIPGGAAIVTIGTCALFTVFTGASGVTIIALGGVLMPALVRNGYPEKFSIGLIAGTGSVGLLFPPALPLFIYGAVYGLTTVSDPAAAAEWDTRRFLFAGAVPGIVLISMLSAVAVFVAVKNKLPRQRFEVNELLKSFVAALPELFIPFGVILALASGIGLPEVAALTVLYVIILELAVLRMVSVGTLWGVSKEALAMVGAIFIIIFASAVLTNFMVTAQVPAKLVAWTQENVESKILFLLALNLLLLLVGTVMDIFSAMVVVVPLIAPIAKAYGIDPYHLGVIFLLNLEVGYLHPPVGLNLFLTSVKFQRPITEVMWATMPFLITMLVALFTVTYIPALTVVPEAERTSPVKTLVDIVHIGVEESAVGVREIKLVDASGVELKDAKGQPIVRKFDECAAITDETKKTVCQNLFFNVTECKKQPDPAKCSNQAIADWTVRELNQDPEDYEKAIVVVREVVLYDEDGKPVMDGGKPVVKKLAKCDALTGTERETCRAVFILASNCKIAPPESGVDACGREEVAKWVAEYPDEAKVSDGALEGPAFPAAEGAEPPAPPPPGDGSGSAAGSAGSAAGSAGSAGSASTQAPGSAGSGQ